MEGEDPSKPESFSSPESFIAAPFWKKLIIILGGVTMNILIAWLLFTVLFIHGTQPLGVSSHPESRSYLMPSQAFLEEKGLLSGSLSSGVLISEVLEDSLALSYGLKPGIVIYRVNDVPVDISTFSSLISSFSHQSFRLDLGEEKEVRISCPETCKLGISIVPHSQMEILDIKF